MGATGVGAGAEEKAGLWKPLAMEIHLCGFVG
jgi:hypothetical protein